MIVFLRIAFKRLRLAPLYLWASLCGASETLLSGDETYQDIFRDFSQMASNNPEKLNRFQQDSQKFWSF